MIFLSPDGNVPALTKRKEQKRERKKQIKEKGKQERKQVGKAGNHKTAFLEKTCPKGKEALRRKFLFLFSPISFSHNSLTHSQHLRRQR